MHKRTIVSPEFGLGKGGIQSWAYYINKTLKNAYGGKTTIIALREMKIKSFADLLKTNINPQLYFLMTWKMSIAILPSLFLDLFRKNKGRYIVFVHGNDILNLSRFQRNCLRALINNSRFSFVANSNAIAQIFYDKFAQKANIVIPPFIDTEELINQAVYNKSVPLQNGEIIFFTLTRLVKRKNISNVIIALNNLKQKGLHFKYLIGGTGPEIKNLESLIKDLRLDKQVQLLGRITEKDKIAYLNKAHFFLLPSIFDTNDGSIEGYGIAYIEANAFSTPVLAGNTGGMTEAVKNEQTGLLCDGTIEDIQSKIENLTQFQFSKKVLIDHARAHDFRFQKEFINYVNNISISKQNE